MRILLLGKDGMLGKDLQKVFQNENLTALGRNDLDITNEEDVFEKLMEIQPEVVINATGYTQVEPAEKDEELANKINGYAVGILARACREIGAILVHFSTDYVFDGSNSKGYTEDDSMFPLNAYGRSKMLGELLLIEEMEVESIDFEENNLSEGKYFIIRTSWLFGDHEKSFHRRMIKKAEQGVPFKVVNDQHGKPTYTIDLANQIKWLIESREYPSGIYHITNNEPTTWYEFARAILSYKKLEHLIEPCTSDAFPTAVKRPKHSVLLNTKLPELRSWREALKELDLT